MVASLFDSGHYESIRVVDPAGKVISERVAGAVELDAPVWFAHILPIHALAGRKQISSGWKQFGTIDYDQPQPFCLWRSVEDCL